VILVGKEFDGIVHSYKHFQTSAEAATYVKEHQPANAAILIKGSRGSKMEVLLDALS
jgi:UDP-N-acetylmuramoyl-tripeptide--D-alanyl-D-alanine ligase